MWEEDKPKIKFMDEGVWETDDLVTALRLVFSWAHNVRLSKGVLAQGDIRVTTYARNDKKDGYVEPLRNTYLSAKCPFSGARHPLPSP